MAIVHKLLQDGAFVAGDTATRRTCYAYPTSAHAMEAKRSPDKTAAEMMAGETTARTPHLDDYDTRNWARIES